MTFAQSPETVVRQPRMALPLMRTSPVIDSIIDAAEWRDATETLQFLFVRQDADFPAEAHVWLGRDSERLYIAARTMANPLGFRFGPPPPPRRGNGGILGAFFADCFELDFTDDKSAALESVSHMIVTARGCYFSLGTRNAKPASWDPPGFKTASTVTNGYWNFEYSVSLKDLGFTPEHDAVHGIRIARDWRGIGSSSPEMDCTQSSLTPYDSAFEKAAGCFFIPFEDDAPVVQLVDLGINGSGGDKYAESYPVKVRVANPTAKPLALRVRLFGKPVNSQPMLTEQDLTLAPGEEKTFEDRGAVLTDEKVFIQVAVFSQDGTKTFYDRTFTFRPNFGRIPWFAPDAKNAGAELKFAYYPSSDKMRVRADFSADAAHGKGATVRFAVLNAKGETLKTFEGKADKESVFDEIVDMPDLAAETRRIGCGEYRLVMTADGVEGGVQTNRFMRDVFEWESNKYGLSDTVPMPFKPVKREKVGGESSRLRDASACQGSTEELEKVSVILRDHIVDKKTGLWKQVMAAGKDLLARPMRLVAARPESAPYRADDAAMVGGDLRAPRGFSTSTFNLQPSTFNLSTSSTWDVDGMMKWVLTLKPGHYEPMALEIPLKGERAPLLHSCTDGIRISYAGAVPPGEGVVWKSSQVSHIGIVGDFVPYIWVGGTLRGIAVFGDNDKGWILKDGVQHQEIIREKDGTVVIRLNLVQRAIDLTEPRTITLGFQATPVKPMPENWRAHDFGVFYGSGKCWGCGQTDSDVCPWDGTDAFWRKMAEARETGVIDQEFMKDTLARFPYAGKPGSKEQANWRERVTRHFWSGMRNAQGARHYRPLTWYTNARGMDLSTKQGATFCDEWNRQEWSDRHVDFNILDHRDYDLDPGKSFQDYAAWWYRKSVALGACDNYYWDDIYLCPNYDLAGTDAYRLPEGDIQPSTGLFNMRGLIKRCAMVQAELGRPWRGNWLHMTSTAIAPILSFAGVNYDLEDGGSVNDFQDRYGREYLLASTIGRQHGNIVKVMGYFGKTTPEEKERLHRCGTGVMLVIEAYWGKSGQYVKINDKLVEWGYRSPAVKVWNDFDEDIPFPVALTGERAYALAMAKENEAIVIVCDWADGGTVTVRPDCATLGIPKDFKAFDFESGAELKVKDGTVDVTLKKHDFAVIRMTK